MKKQWMIRLSAVALALLTTACEIGGGGGTTTSSDTGSIPYSGADTGIIPDSGQTSCYYDYTIEDFDGDGIDDFYNPVKTYCVSEIAAWQPYGQDGNHPINPMSYTDNGDGTVLDNITGLTWQQCALGESGAGCTLGSIGSYSWSEANAVCAGSTLAGGGWRLPTVTELMRIVDYEESFGTIDYTAFPGGTVSPYWTSTPHAVYSSWAWYVGFSQGVVGVDDKVDYHYARCVRG
jgi:hypothetical protein